MTDRPHYWVSFFAMTIAQALRSKEPEKILRPTLQRFMREESANDIRAQLAGALQKEKIHEAR